MKKEVLRVETYLGQVINAEINVLEKKGDEILMLSWDGIYKELVNFNGVWSVVREYNDIPPRWLNPERNKNV